MRRMSDPTSHDEQSSEQAIVVMGVSGSGKTTLAQLLATDLGWTFAEADEFHPATNIEKMTRGEPLTDDDRGPWLGAIRDWLTAESAAGRSAVVTCSALKRVYRDVLRSAHPRVRFVHVTADPAVIADRMSRRKGHFMPPSLLPSQLETLEPLGPDEDGITVTADVSPRALARRVLHELVLPADRRPRSSAS